MHGGRGPALQLGKVGSEARREGGPRGWEGGGEAGSSQREEGWLEGEEGWGCLAGSREEVARRREESRRVWGRGAGRGEEGGRQGARRGGSLGEMGKGRSGKRRRGGGREGSLVRREGKPTPRPSGVRGLQRGAPPASQGLAPSP